MKFILLILTTLFIFNSSAFSQEATDLRPLSLGNIEFSLYTNPSEETLKVQFLLPRAQVLEMYLIDQTGDFLGEVKEKQFVIAGVKTYDYNFPKNTQNGMYFLVIKANDKSIIKKVDYTKKP